MRHFNECVHFKNVLNHVSAYPIIYYNMYFPTVKYSIQLLTCQIVEPIFATSENASQALC